MSLRNLQTRMYSWLNVRPAVLDEVVSLDGPGNSDLNLCNLCSNSQLTSVYRCMECSHSLLCCGECIVEAHRFLPLHRLEVYLVPRYTTFITHVTRSTGRTSSLTEPPSVHLDSFVTLGITVTRAL